MRTTAIMNLKGGTAKTVTAINLAAILAKDYGEQVLLVDADSQANLTEFAMLMPAGSVAPGKLSDLLTGKKVAPSPTKLHGMKILPADETLMALDITKAGSGEVNPMALADFLECQEKNFDHCVIDCPPAFSASAMAALIAADEVIIPMKLDAFGIRGMANLLEQIRNMKRINADLTVAGVLPTMIYKSERLAETEKELREALEKKGIRVFCHIRRSIKVDEMTFTQKPLIYSAPKCVAAYDYKYFVWELMDGEEGGAV